MSSPVEVSPGVVCRLAARSLSSQSKIITGMTKLLKTILVTKSPTVFHQRVDAIFSEGAEDQPMPGFGMTSCPTISHGLSPSRPPWHPLLSGTPDISVRLGHLVDAYVAKGVDYSFLLSSISELLSLTKTGLEQSGPRF